MTGTPPESGPPPLPSRRRPASVWEREAVRRSLPVIAGITSAWLTLVGLGVGVLALNAADGQRFFFAMAALVLAAGLSGLALAWLPIHGVAFTGLRFVAGLANVALSVAVMYLPVTGIARGPLLIGLPLLVGLPCLPTVLAAYLDPRRRSRGYGPGPDGAPRCSACGYDLRGSQGTHCPECEHRIAPR